MASLIIGTNGGETLTVVIPHCRSLGMCSGRPASSPHTEERGTCGTSSWVMRSSLKMGSAACARSCSCASHAMSVRWLSGMSCDSIDREREAWKE